MKFDKAGYLDKSFNSQKFRLNINGEKMLKASDQNLNQQHKASFSTYQRQNTKGGNFNTFI